MVVTLQEHNGQYRLTIPKEIVELEGLKKGDKFKITKIPGYLALEPIR
jgi:bifunctional DNA-binding transcriptional regulator/antitoxin component of YhaV-PrlF toxin-antitoxin module